MKIDSARLLERVEVAWARRRMRGADVAALPRPYPDRPIGTESLSEIGHIVVLMMENHSYDNYLGLLERGMACRRTAMATRRRPICRSAEIVSGSIT